MRRPVRNPVARLARPPAPVLVVVCALLLLVLAACDGAAAGADRSTARGGLALDPCHLAAPGAPERLPAECGTLRVAEDPARPDGRAIDLRIALLPAVSRRPEIDPVFFLAGGPGQAATEAYPAMAPAFNRLNQHRDIVLVDQRGTGGSHPLACPMPADRGGEDGGAGGAGGETGGDVAAEPGGETGGDVAAEPGGDLGTESGGDFDPEQVRSLARDCLDQLDADPRQYTTSSAVADLDAVRAALGYDQVNLYGVSYGTRVALEYARRHPDRVRTMVLDGVLPPEIALGSTAGRDAQGALDLILERCETDAACREAFPDIRDSFADLQADLTERPQPITLADPSTGASTTTTLDWPKVATALRFLSYSPETAALIPLLIHTAQVERNPIPLAAQFIRVTEDLGGEISGGLNNSVVCAEDVPFFDPTELDRLNQDTFLGDLVSDSLMATCEVWPQGEVPADFKQPLASEIPALLLSGEADPVTPPAYADQVARTLPAARRITVPGFGHGVGTRGCIPRLITAFVETGDAAGLDDACVGEIEAVPFFRSFNGPGMPVDSR